MKKIILVLFIISLIVLWGCELPESNPCEIKPGILQDCIDSPDCTLSATELYRYNGRQKAIEHQCPIKK